MKTKKRILFSSIITILFLAICFSYFPKMSTPVQGFANESFEVTDELDEKIIEEVNESSDFRSDRVIVVLDKSLSSPEGLSNDVINNLFDEIEYTNIKDLSKVILNNSLEDYYSQNAFRQILRIDLEEQSKENVMEVIEQLQIMEEVVYAGPDYISTTESLQPNDPYYTDGSQWGLNGEFGIDIESAWNITTGSQEVIVGVMDSGISFHQELYTKVSFGYDFVNDNNTTTDDMVGHGTHVAGIIAATSNSNGIVGVAPNVRLAALQVAKWDDEEAKYSISVSDKLEVMGMATGFWGTPYQISVLNHSISGFGIETSMLYSISQYPGIFVWSAGNGVPNEYGINFGVDVDTYSNINSFDLDNLISVGAINNSGEKVYFSDYGNGVDIYAPGTDIWSSEPNNDYGSRQGTSMAAPFVSGVAALLFSDNPGLTASQVKNAIINGATDITITGNNGSDYSSVRLSAIGALNYAQQHCNVIPAPLRLSVEGKSNGVWSINLRNPNNFAVYAAYNSKMCIATDAKNFSGLSDIVDVTIAARSTTTVSISENLLAGWITASIGYSVGENHYRVISCAHGLSEGSSTFSYYVEHNTISVLKYTEVSSPPNYLSFSITSGASGGKWTVKIVNNSSSKVNITYNSKLCFVEDAKSFSGLGDDLVSTSISPNSSKTVTISTNWFADYITAKIEYYYHGFAYSRVTYAKAAVSPSCGYNQIRHL